MVCFSSMGRIRLNSIIKRPTPFAVQVTAHCAWIAMLLLTENKKRMCGQGQREGISRRDQPWSATGLQGPQKRLINNSAGALELESWRSLSPIIPSPSNTKEGLELNSQLWIVKFRVWKKQGSASFWLFVNLAACLFVLNGYCAFWIQNLIIFN